jgi:integrase
MAKGVEPRYGKLRLYFTFDGKLRRELTDLDDTPENIAYAQRMVENIKHEIKAGSFDYSRYFPNSKELAENSIGHYARLWLDLKKSQVAASTFYGYSTCVDRIVNKFDARHAEAVDYIEIERWITEDMGHLASKTIKETIAVLRQIYALYQTRNRKAWDPTTGVRVRLPDQDDPDPFNRAEIEAMLKFPTHRVQDINLIEFMLWSGPRVSEAIALAWEDVDLKAGVVKYRRAAVRKAYKSTKTRRSNRKTELLKPALEALVRQWAITGNMPPIEIEVLERDNRTIRREKIHPVFRQAKSDLPYTSDFVLRDRFFMDHLRKAGIRPRGPGNCRHTFISQCLTAGLPVKWIADQVGHTTPSMIYRRYGKWITADADDVRKLAESRLGFD